MWRVFYMICLIYPGSDVVSQKTPPEISDTAVAKMDLVFDHLKDRDGLSYNSVSDILQDNAGMLWISTYSGLNRYDGKRFEVFKKNNKDSSSIISNYIVQLCKGKEGNIWGSTTEGLFCYDVNSKIFKRYYNGDNINSPGLTGLDCDVNGQIWAGSLYGLHRLNIQKGIFDIFTHNKKDKYSITSDVIKQNGIVSDYFGKGLWIATPSGLNYYDLTTSRFINHQNETTRQIFNNHSIGTIHLTKNGILWLLDETDQTIVGIQNDTKEKIYTIELKGKIKEAYDGTLFETSDHKLWYSSISYETIIIDYKNNNKYSLIKSDQSNKESICSDRVSAVWEDKDNTIWLGTPNGISRFNEKRLFYKITKLADTYPELDQNWQITCLAEDRNNGTWWLGTRDGAVYVYDSHTNKIKKIDFKSYKNNAQPYQYITDIDFIEGKAIISYYNGITHQYDITSGKYEKFYPLKGKYEEYRARTISRETDSTYLIGNNFTPILRWNAYRNTFQEINYSVPNNKNGEKYMTGWLKSSLGIGTWLASQNSSLGYIPLGSTTIHPFPMDTSKILCGFINALEIDYQGNAWIAYYGLGLIEVIKKKNDVLERNDVAFKKWDSSDGLVNDLVLSSVSDKNGHVWAASYNKFSVFNPRTNKFTNFEINHSEHNMFYYNYMIALSNGNILTNIKGSLVEFFPDMMTQTQPKNGLLISKIALQSRNIYLTSEKVIYLKPNENFINIAFGCLSSDKTYGYHFEYTLEGVNNGWVKSGQKAEATYTDLSPGKYTFRLIARSEDPGWSSDEKTLTIIIETPFYKSWWFILCLLSFITFLVYSIIQGRIKSIRDMNLLKSKAYLLEKEKTAVMYENLKQHLNPHFLFNSLTSLSSLIRFDQQQAGDFLDKMSKVYRYILKNKDIETVPLFEELKFINMYIQLQKTRFDKGLEIDINVPEELTDRKIAPVTLQNLVENAIKHNIADDETPLTIRIYIEQDYLIVQNNLNKKNFVETSNQQGQMSMVALYRFLSNKPVIIQESESHYTVRIPLL